MHGPLRPSETERYGRVILAACLLVQGVTIGGMFAYGVLFPELEAAFGWSRATIAGASALGTLVMGAGAILAGRLSDRFGPRVVLSVSAVVYGAGFFLMSVLQAPWQLFLFWGLLVGLGLSTHDVVTLSTVARWFPARRGIMSGIVKLGTATGQLVVPLLAAALVAALGWREACRWMGGAALVVLFVAAQLMRRDPDSRAAASTPSGSGPVAAGGTGMGFREALREPLLWLLCFSQFLAFSCLMTTTVHIVPHGVDLGLSQGTAAGVLSAIGGMSVLGRLAIGGAIDRIGGRRGLLVVYAILVISFAWLQVADRVWMLYLFAAVYGFAHGGFFTAMSPTIAEFFGMRAHGVLFGTVLFFGSLGGALGPVATGAIFDAMGSYRVAFAGLATLAATGFVLVTRLPRRERVRRA